MAKNYERFDNPVVADGAGSRIGINSGDSQSPENFVQSAGSGSGSDGRSYDYPEDPYASKEYGDSYENSQPGPNTNRVLDFSEQSIRRGFVRKVFGILTVQFLVTSGIIALFVLQSDLKTIAATPPFVTAAAVIALILTVMTYACDNLRRKSPHNFFLLGALTFGYSLFAGSMAAFFSVEVVLYATGVTCIITVTLLLLSIQSVVKLSFSSTFLIVVTVVFFAGGIFAYVMSVTVNKQIGDDAADMEERTLSIVLGCIIAILFGAILLYDMKRILSGQHMFSFSPEDYVLGAMVLYADIIMMFIVILVILGVTQKGNLCPTRGAYRDVCVCCWPVSGGGRQRRGTSSTMGMADDNSIGDRRASQQSV